MPCTLWTKFTKTNLNNGPRFYMSSFLWLRKKLRLPFVINKLDPFTDHILFFSTILEYKKAIRSDLSNFVAVFIWDWPRWKVSSFYFLRPYYPPLVSLATVSVKNTIEDIQHKRTFFRMQSGIQLVIVPTSALSLFEEFELSAEEVLSI